MSLDINISKQPGGVCVFRLDGQLNEDTYEALSKRLEPFYNKETMVLIMDFEKLLYISSIGLGVIFRARREIETGGGTFIMTNLQPQIKKIFEIVKALPEKPVFENMEEVDKYLKLMQENEIEKQRGVTEE